MPSIQEKINAKLELQQNALMRIGDEYCESGNQYVVSAGMWLRPVVTDFIAMVRDRHQAIVDYAARELILDADIVKAADLFFEETVEALLPVFPMPVRAQVRGITSQIKNDLAIARIISDEKILLKNPTAADGCEQGWRDRITEIGSDPEKFKSFCEKSLPCRDGICAIIFNKQFFNFSIHCLKDRPRDALVKSSPSKASFVDRPAHQTRSYKTNFDAFRAYWKSLPHGNLMLALAIKKLLQDDELLQHIICHKADVKEMLLVYSPTVELRRHLLENILRTDYLDVRLVTRLYEYLPEGKSVNWQVEFALLGIKNYQNMPHTKEQFSSDWETSKQKNRAETYASLLENYKDAIPLIKKIIVYAMLESNGRKLQQQVYKVMGGANLESTKKTFRDSIKQEAQHLQIDFGQIADTVVAPLVKQTSAKRTLASGAYQPVIDELNSLIPRSRAFS